MAWSILRPPGHAHGPCLNEACGHVDCEGTREDAARVCPLCGKPIGYDRQITSDHAATPAHRTLVHWVCSMKQLDEIENKSKARHAPGQPKLDLGE
jgi:hypothetical protein